jgi:hypothetical protein
MAWAMVIAAGLPESVWSYSSKRSDGFTRLGRAGLAVIASRVSFAYWYFQCVACRLAQPTPSGPASGQRKLFGGHCRFGRVRHGWRIASAALIVLGVCGLRLTNTE